MVGSVILVSNDAALAECCRDILCELFASEWRLVTGPRGYQTSPDSICIWDFTPGGIMIPPDLRGAKARGHWFLLERKDLAALHAVVGTTDLNIRWKPASRATLRELLRKANREGKEHTDFTRLVEVLRVERDEMLRTLIQANLKVQENGQERNNFLARSVHDLGAPLTALRGYCGMLLEEILGPLTSEQRKVLERMLHSANRLARISHGMFELSVPQDVDHRLNLERTDLRACIDEAIHEVALPLEDKRISVAVELETRADGLFFEKSLIEQTLINLLDNACKFTPRDGTIEIRGYPFFWERRTRQAPALDLMLERRTRQVEAFNSFRVDIRDSGPGIPAGLVEGIFDQDTSYAGGQDRSSGGLGLAICRMVLNRHQGRIWAESSHAGAVFSFVLPFHEKPAGISETNRSSDTASLVGTVEA